MIDVVLVADDKNILRSCLKAKKWSEVIDNHEYVKSDATEIFKIAVQNGFYCPTVKSHGAYGIMIIWEEEENILKFILDGEIITYDLVVNNTKRLGTSVTLDRINIIFKGLEKKFYGCHKV